MLAILIAKTKNKWTDRNFLCFKKGFGLGRYQHVYGAVGINMCSRLAESARQLETIWTLLTGINHIRLLRYP
jgi:hypothetical protein